MNKFYNAELAAGLEEVAELDRIAELAAKALDNPDILDELELEDLVMLNKYYVELICGIGKLSECAVPVREMAERHWKLACPKWQQLDDYKGKDSYMYHIVWQIDKRRAESE